MLHFIGSWIIFQLQSLGKGEMEVQHQVMSMVTVLVLK